MHLFQQKLAFYMVPRHLRCVESVVESMLVIRQSLDIVETGNKTSLKNVLWMIVSEEKVICKLMG